MTTTLPPWSCISLIKSLRVARETNFSEGRLTHFPSRSRGFSTIPKMKQQNGNSLRNVSKVCGAPRGVKWFPVDPKKTTQEENDSLKNPYPPEFEAFPYQNLHTKNWVGQGLGLPSKSALQKSQSLGVGFTVGHGVNLFLGSTNLGANPWSQLLAEKNN